MSLKSAKVSAGAEPEEKAAMRKEISYSMTVPSAPKARDEMSSSEFDAMMETGLSQAKKGDAVSADEAFNELIRECE